MQQRSVGRWRLNTEDGNEQSQATRDLCQSSFSGAAGTESRLWWTQGIVGGEEVGTGSREHRFRTFGKKEIKRNWRVVKKENQVGRSISKIIRWGQKFGGKRDVGYIVKGYLLGIWSIVKMKAFDIELKERLLFKMKGRRDR